MREINKEIAKRIAIILLIGVIPISIILYSSLYEAWTDLFIILIVLVIIFIVLFTFSTGTGRWEQIVIDRQIEEVISTIETYLINNKIKYQLTEKMKDYYFDPGKYRFELIEIRTNLYIAKESQPNPDYTRIWISKKSSDSIPELNEITSYLSGRFNVYTLADYLSSGSTKI
ncbi:MAG: hypothetical protein JSW00_04415 [Thermoplasmata archaeon]|nr:MAG: hypothetical protein JSW00_04415 [Thermoplasmata archaeon]